VPLAVFGAALLHPVKCPFGIGRKRRVIKTNQSKIGLA
jgi:hypothetical protein